MKKKLGMIVLSTLLVIISVFSMGCLQKDKKAKLKFIVDGDVYETIVLEDFDEINMPQDPVKEGMIFDGWYWDEGVWHIKLDESQLFRGEITNNAEVYAKWIVDPNAGDNTPDDPIPDDPTPDTPTPDDPIPEDPTPEPEPEPEPEPIYYTITLDLNGGEMDGETTIQVEYGESFTLPVVTKGTTYTFNGWSTSKYSLNAVTEPNGVSIDVYSYNTNKTFYAYFTEYKYFIESNNYYRGSHSPHTGSTGNVAVAGTPITLKAFPESGCYFVGWYNKNDGTLISEDKEYTFIMPYSNYSIEAKFDIYKYTISIIGNNANAGTTNDFTDREFNYGHQLTLNATTNKGYTFLGWYKDGELFTEELRQKITIYEDATYEARWTYYYVSVKYPYPNPVRGKITVKSPTTTKELVYKSDGAGGNLGNFYEMIERGSSVTITTEPYTTPASNGKIYTWIGYKDSGTIISSEYTLTLTITDESYSITPTWEVCSVSVSSTDEEGGTVSMDQFPVYGKPATIKAEPKVGYIWQGWHLNEELVTTDQTFEEIISTQTKNYVAKWELCTEHEFVDCYCICNTENHTLNQSSIQYDANMYCIHEDRGVICFGMYPQGQVTDETLMNALKNALEEKNTESVNYPSDALYNGNFWTEYPYLSSFNYNYRPADYCSNYYHDLEYEGNKYRAVYLIAYRPIDAVDNATADNSYQDNNGYALRTLYWFKYEPIKWNIIGEENGKYLLMSDLIIDAQQYQDGYTESEVWISNKLHHYTYNASNRKYFTSGVHNTAWYASSLRKWLNESFYNTAFGYYERQMVATRWSGTNSDYHQERNEDKLYIDSSTEDYVYYDNNERKIIETKYGNSELSLYKTSDNPGAIDVCDNIFLANANTLKQLIEEGLELSKTSTDYSKMQGLGYDEYFMRSNFLDPADDISIRHKDYTSRYDAMPYINESGEFDGYMYSGSGRYSMISGVVPMMIFDINAQPELP